LRIVAEPQTPRSGEQTTLNVTGHAVGGRYLTIQGFAWHAPGGNGGWGPEPFCRPRAGRSPVVIEDVALTQRHLWRGRGRHKVTLTLIAPCRSDIPLQTVTAEFIVS